MDRPHTSPAIDSARVEQTRVMRRVFWRLIPFLFALYVCAYLDRVNLSYAALSIRRELGFSDTIYGAGAGLFFLSYAIFQVPSNLILVRIGPRRWIAIIMTAWGILSASMALIHTPFTFYLVRFLLGAAEAGFFPGIILYLTYWFPPAQRARAIARFMTAAAVAGVIGAPLSTLLLRLDGVAHIAGWKWLFVGEGLPSVLLGIAVLFVLADRPEEAAWLAPAERNWLLEEIARRTPEDTSSTTLLHAVRSLAVWLLAFIYFANSLALYGLSLWLPVVVKNFTHAVDLRVVALTTIPYGIAAVAMLLVARSSDKSRERKWHLCVCLTAAAIAFLLSAIVANPLLALSALFLTTAGTWGGFGPFWALPTGMLRGAAAAGGIAIINSVGALGGFCGPYLMGRVSDLTHSFRAALLVASALLVIAAFVAAMLKPSHQQAMPVPEQAK
jgi:ACS family tartrate transporter-like MFS transporter